MLTLALALLAQEVDNPDYAAWARFRPGSTVTVRIEIEASGGKSVTEATSTLKSVDAKEAVVEVKGFTEALGRREEIAAREERVPAKVRRPAPSKAEEADEEIEVAGKKLACRRITVTDQQGALATATVTWTSDQIPGGLAKREIREGAGVTRVRTTAWEAKP
jgi:hypothetical protein